MFIRQENLSVKEMQNGKTPKSSVVAEKTMVVALSFRILNIPLSISYRKAWMKPLKVHSMRIWVVKSTWIININVRV